MLGLAGRKGTGGSRLFSGFAFKNSAAVDRLFSLYPDNDAGRRSATIPLLHLAQAELGGFITDDALEAIAELTGQRFRTVSRVHRFYHMFRRAAPEETYTVCRSVPCMLAGADECAAELERMGAKVARVECLGLCHEAPVIREGFIGSPVCE
eukprot:gnl/Chilomastix_cuspidata/806.p1 GENE.gnl/Chilomastix_cuspidata/806~~gnl/Chilomastix_cuspidata/806.p1  ORF type:complete len:152 (+),score=34.10 gnl/Chilomastix_cuspidata/806:39-494(+)